MAVCRKGAGLLAFFVLFFFFFFFFLHDSFTFSSPFGDMSRAQLFKASLDY